MLPRMLWAKHRRVRDEEVGLSVCNDNDYGTLESRKHERNMELTPSAMNPWAQNWMSEIEDDTLMSGLSIPGTHDSAAFTRPWPFIATQQMNILQQLDSGIRYFDLRCGIRDDIAVMVHGPSLLGLALSEVLDAMYGWLNLHPREALIVQIKEDRAPERSKVHFAQVISSYIAARSERWRTANTTPSLGELRGRIQLFRRFRGPSPMEYGIDVTEWMDNPVLPFTIFTRNQVQLTIQDHYSFPDPKPLPDLIAAKGGDVSRLLDRAAKDPEDEHWYLNFTSAYEFNFYYQITPRAIAVGGYFNFRWEDGMNPRLRNYLQSREGRQRYGIVAMDFPEVGSEDLIETLIISNRKAEGDSRKAILTILVIMVLVICWIALRHVDDIWPLGGDVIHASLQDMQTAG